MADLKGGTTGQVLKKNSNTDMDFVWSADSAGMTNPMTTTGDTIYSSSGSTPARLGIGSTGQILTVSGGVPVWAAAPASGGATLLSTTSMSGSSSITISSISQSYKNLQIIITGVSWNTSDSELRMYFGASGTNTACGRVVFTASTGGFFNNDQLKFTGANNVDRTFAQSYSVNIYNYTSTGKYTFDVAGIAAPSGGGSPAGPIGGGGINSTSALSTVCFETAHGTTFNAGTIKIYGVN